MTFEEELEAIVKEIGEEPIKSNPSNNKMSKSEFMSKYINDMYDKRYKKKRNEATEFLIEGATKKRINSEKRKRRGVLKYEF